MILQVMLNFVVPISAGPIGPYSGTESVAVLICVYRLQWNITNLTFSGILNRHGHFKHTL
jgi:hypothetical protein